MGGGDNYLRLVLFNNQGGIVEDRNIVFYKREAVRTQSKLVNYQSSSVSGRLRLILQKYSGGVWQDRRIVVDKQVTIPANGMIKLDNEWNPQNVIADAVGKYRIYGEFNASGEITEANWEFDVAL